MLNITHNTIKKKEILYQYESFKFLEKKNTSTTLIRIMCLFFAILVLTLLLPWTQNVQSSAVVTALRPDQRPQTIHSAIAGRIEKWFIQEGQFVKKGDTILYISEVKGEYLDPNLIENTQEQIKSKEFAVKSYMEKVKANDRQIDALINVSKLKQEQARNKLIQAGLKVKSDSVDLLAMQLKFSIAKAQLSRMESLYKDGLKSLTDLETRKLKMQEEEAKLIAQENKLLAAKNEVLNARIELEGILSEYRDKIAKSESDKYATLSYMYDAEAVVTKLQNQYMNYSIRSGMYFILAPQDGYITKAVKSGIGETIKEGAEIISIMPSNYQLAVEMYVSPMDIPLLEKKQRVRIQFDGWPAVVFSGWPGISYGTYAGDIIAIDNFISQNGKYRVLVAQDTSNHIHPWPKEIRIGAGARTITLLKDEPIWYELWRQINGFPADYYKQNDDVKKKDEK